MSSEITTPLVVTGLPTPTARPNNIPQGNATAQRPGQNQARERSEVTTPLIVTGLQTPAVGPNNRQQQENAITQRPRQYQARERSPNRVQLNFREQEDSSPRSSYEAIAEVTSIPGSGVVAPPSTEVLPTTPLGMPHSSLINESASYDVWRSSMTDLLDMEKEEFEQMSNLTSE